MKHKLNAQQFKILFYIDFFWCGLYFFVFVASIVAVMDRMMPIQPMDWEIVVMKLIAVIHPCRNADARIIRNPTSPIPAPIPMMNFAILVLWLSISEPPIITEMPPRSAIMVSACRSSESRSAVAPPKFSIRYSITVPMMPVDPAAPAINSRVPPKYANNAAIFLVSINNCYT